MPLQESNRGCDQNTGASASDDEVPDVPERVVEKDFVVASMNVLSLPVRLVQTLRLAVRHGVDVLCVQEANVHVKGKLGIREAARAAGFGVISTCLTGTRGSSWLFFTG